MYPSEPNDRVSAKFQVKPEEGCNDVHTAATPRGLTGHIALRYKLSICNQMSEKPRGGGGGGVLEGFF